ncbi:uncharacterized protein DEA37_0013402 [Paragonimus westermani]|uniref:Reverse transcriptase/retrotransposon-derived protein RNase H-like domain-containing protein n=1 Tax=Paragonimus westermani TaxID=34504 RepID=A0A5J4NB12_9TREM|nr:uncharacterized protein DEA37_0013402 [Paragonimus westermani]
MDDSVIEEELRLKEEELRFMRAQLEFRKRLKERSDFGKTEEPTERNRAKAAIEHCVLLSSEVGFTVATGILRRRFGRPHETNQAISEDVFNGPRVAKTETEGLQLLATQMKGCQLTLSQLNHPSELSCPTNLLRIMDRLPRPLQEKWVVVADSVSTTGREPFFNDLLEFRDRRISISSNLYGQLIAHSSRGHINGTENVRFPEDSQRMPHVSTAVGVRANRMVESTATLKDGRYEIGLPWRFDGVNLTDSRWMAQKRLNLLRRRLSHDTESARKYSEIIRAHVVRGNISRVDTSEDKTHRLYYLSHHPVLNSNKPGKVRILFDCAAEYKDTSFNKVLLQRPVLTNNLVGVLFRFRKGLVAWSSDIEEMFLQVKVPERDRWALSLLWWSNEPMSGSPDKRTPVQYQSQLDTMIQGVRNKRFIRSSTFPWAFLRVGGREGWVHTVCVAHKHLNAVTKRVSFPLPRTDTTLDVLPGTKWFCLLDLAPEYRQVEISSAPILASPDFSPSAVPFILHTDASDLAIGAVLSQKSANGEVVIVYANSQLDKQHQSKSQQHQKSCHDRTANGPVYRIRDQVWLYAPEQPLGAPHKFHQPWLGPFVNVHMRSPTVYVNRDTPNPIADVPTLHCNQLKPPKTPEDAHMRPLPVPPGSLTIAEETVGIPAQVDRSNIGSTETLGSVPHWEGAAYQYRNCCTCNLNSPLRFSYFDLFQVDRLPIIRRVPRTSWTSLDL